jgi:spermidine synthase
VAALEPYVIVFLASAAGLVIEIVAARILAPVIGVSLYTWTSVIGIVLAGISLGNFLGGLVADRGASRALLGMILGGSALMSIAILPLVAFVPAWLGGLPILARIVLMTTLLFFVPSMLLGMVSPIVIKLQLQDLGKTGKVVGRLYAVSTFGAIAGVFLTGFVLVQWIGSRTTIAVVAASLLVMALGFGRLWRFRAPLNGPGLLRPLLRAVWLLRPGATIVVLAAGALFFYAVQGGYFQTSCVDESAYYCIKINDGPEGTTNVKALVLDQLVHSYVSLDDPTDLSKYGYEEVFSEVAEHVAAKASDFRSLFIGGGGYVLPRYFEVTYPESRIEVIEIDPAVTRAVYEHLGLWADSRIVTYNEDARMTVPKLERGQYSIVVGDAFNDVSVPYHLTTREFNDGVRDLLVPGGVYVVNIVDRPHTGQFLRSFVHTMRQTFPYVTLLNADGYWFNDLRSTTVVMGSTLEITRNDLSEAARRLGKAAATSHLITPATLEELVTERRATLLTDDHAPVDQMLAPLYLESR